MKHVYKINSIGVIKHRIVSDFMANVYKKVTKRFSSNNIYVIKDC